MNESTRPHARADARPMASQAHPDAFAGPFSGLDWQMRPILVLQVSQDPVFDTPEGVVPVIRRMAESLTGVGMSTADANLVHFDGNRIDFHWPRNLAWKPLPTIEEPQARFFFHSVHPMVEEGLELADGVGMPVPGLEHDHAVGRVQRLLVEGVATVVVVAAALSSRLLRAATAPFDGRSMPRVLHFDGETLSDVAAGEVEAAREAFGAHERFAYNHAVNMIVLTSRALFKVARDAGWGRSATQRRLPALNHFDCMFGDPLVLQALHEVARSGVRAEPGQKPDKVPHEERPWHMAKGLPFVVEDAPNDFAVRWEGTGKHAPWTFPLGVIEPPGTEFRGMGSGRAHPPLLMTLESLDRCGLIGFFGGRVGLTEEGAAFLDIVGPDTRDADMPLRWRTPEGAWGSAADVPAMDRWLNRAFRSVKRRVAGLAASPFVEPDGEWKVPGPNRLLVRGGLLRLDEAALGRLGMPEFVASLDREERTKAFRDLRVGLVRDEEATDPATMPLAVWFGVPLGSFSQPETFQGRATLFLDTSAVDAEAAGLAGPVLERFGVEIPADSRLRVSTIEVGSTHESERRWIDLAPLLRVEPGDETAEVIHGQALEIADVESEEKEVRHLVSFLLAVRDMSPEQTLDGIRIHGDRGGKVVVTYGRVAGQVNVTRGTNVRQREISRQQEHMFRIGQQRDREGYAAFFDHPRLRHEGYWAPTTAGRLFELRGK